MKIALVSDIHANFSALQALSADLEQADLVVCLGDFVGYYCQVNEVLDYMRRLRLICVRGNHDDYLVNGLREGLPGSVRFGIEYADRVIDADHRRWLAELPLTWGGEVAEGLRVLLFHGSPYEPLREYIYASSVGLSREVETRALASLSSFDYDGLFFGHTHRFVLRDEARPLVLNPGSVGQSREAETRGLASLALLDTDTMMVERRLVPYDTQQVIDLARANDAGDWVYKHLA